MQHCGNCGALLSDEALRRGSCSVCQRVVTPDIDTVPTDPQRSHNQGQMNVPASQPFVAMEDGVGAQKLLVSVHGQIGIEHGGNVAVWVPASHLRRRSRLFLLSALVLLLLAATVAVLIVNPASGGKVALQRKTVTTAADATSTAGVAAVAAVSSTKAASGTTIVPQPGQPGGVPITGTVTPSSGDNTPTSAPEITATALPTATTAPNNPPVLYLNPTSISFTLCLGNNATFMVKNTGGGTLKWRASSSDYTFQSPTQGTLGAHQYATVMVNGILLNGSVTVNATDLVGHALPTPPQTFSVKCTA